MARAGLGWTIAALAERTGLSRVTIIHFEQGKYPQRHLRTQQLVRMELERAGAEFVGERGVWLTEANLETGGS